MHDFDYTGYFERGVLDYNQPIHAFKLNEEYNALIPFHLAVWLGGVQTTNFRLIFDHSGNQRIRGNSEIIYVMLFGNKQDFDSFAEWWQPYLTRFNGNESNLYLPTPPVNQTFTATSVKCPLRYDDNVGNAFPVDGDTFTYWSWIAHHTKGNVWRIPESFLFEDADEAVLFKLSHEL